MPDTELIHEFEVDGLRFRCEPPLRLREWKCPNEHERGAAIYLAHMDVRAFCSYEFGHKETARKRARREVLRRVAHQVQCAHRTAAQCQEVTP